MIVYLIRNLLNGKKYVGQTASSLRERWQGHVSSAQSGSRFPIHCAIRKYGVGNFEISELARAANKEELDVLEQKHIAESRSMVPEGYNRTAGGDGFSCWAYK